MINDHFLNVKKCHDQIKKSMSLVPQETYESLIFLLFPPSQEISFPSSYKEPRLIYRDAGTPTSCIETWGDIPVLPLVSHQVAEGRCLLVYWLYGFKDRSYCLHTVLACLDIPSHQFQGRDPCTLLCCRGCVHRTQQLSLKFLILWYSSQKAIF